MPSRKQVTAVGDSLVGTAENPAHSNCTPFIQEFGYPICAAWCAIFVSCILHRVFGRWILHTASVGVAREQAQQGLARMIWHPADAIIQEGWLSLFDFGGRGDWSEFHISYVRNPGDQVNFQTDGGNEQDAVRQQWRNRKFSLGFIEITDYDDAVAVVRSMVPFLQEN